MSLNDLKKEIQAKALDHDELVQKVAALQQRIQELEGALREIQKGMGPYSQDPLEHASNTIEDMKRIATEALKEGEDGAI